MHDDVKDLMYWLKFAALMLSMLAFLYGIYEFQRYSAFMSGEVCVDRPSLYSDCLRYLYSGDKGFEDAVHKKAREVPLFLTSFPAIAVFFEVLGVIVDFVKSRKKK